MRHELLRSFATLGSYLGVFKKIDLINHEVGIWQIGTVVAVRRKMIGLW